MTEGEQQQARSSSSSSEQPAVSPGEREELLIDTYRKLPLSFVANEGQTDEAVRYYAKGAGYGFKVGSGYDPRYPLVIDPGLAYSTFLGGTGFDQGFGIAVNRRSGRAYVTGGTESADYPTTPGTFDGSFNGVFDAFVSKLDPVAARY